MNLLPEALDARFIAFLVVFAVLIITPGPDTAMVTRSALAGGWRASSLTALGIGAGTIAWAAASVLGIAVVISGSPIALTVLQFSGAAYLAYLGARSILGAFRAVPAQVAAGERRGESGLAARQAFRQGLVSNLLNAKTGPFFITVMPQFIEPGDPTARLLAMLLAYEAMLLAWLFLYGYVVSRAASTLVRPSARRALDAVTGLVLLGFSLRLIAERR